MKLLSKRLKASLLLRNCDCRNISRKPHQTLPSLDLYQFDTICFSDPYHFFWSKHNMFLWSESIFAIYLISWFWLEAVLAMVGAVAVVVLFSARCASSLVVVLFSVRCASSLVTLLSPAITSLINNFNHKLLLMPLVLCGLHLWAQCTIRCLIFLNFFFLLDDNSDLFYDVIDILNEWKEFITKLLFGLIDFYLNIKRGKEMPTNSKSCNRIAAWFQSLPFIWKEEVGFLSLLNRG